MSTEPKRGRVNLSRWPLVRLTSPARSNAALVLAATNDLRALLRLRERFCLLVDLSELLNPDLEQMHVISNFLRVEACSFREYVAGVALIAPPRHARNLERVLAQLHEPAFPFAVSPDEDHAMRFLTPQLRPLREAAEALERLRQANAWGSPAPARQWN